MKKDRIQHLLENLREASMRMDELMDVFVEADFMAETADNPASIGAYMSSVEVRVAIHIRPGEKYCNLLGRKN